MNKLTIQNLNIYNFNVYKFLSVFLVSLVGFYISCSKTPTNTEEPKRPQIEVAGSITENTIWESGKDYIVRGVVNVEENAVLTINKDVNIYFTLDSLGNKGKLYVKGMIYADGEDSRTMIVIQPDNMNAGGEEGRGVELFKGKAPSAFKYCSFKNCLYGIKAIQTRLIVADCSFEYCHNGINISKCDSVLVLDSAFSQNVTGVLMELAMGLTDSCIVVSRNIFSNCSKVGVEVTNISKKILITDNYFKDCTIGFLCSFYSLCNFINNNLKNCNLGVKYIEDANGEIKKNVFTGGEDNIVLFVVSYPEIQLNNFLECDRYKLYLQQFRVQDTTNAEHNWWGTNQKVAIELSIFDANDVNAESTFGVVDFEPFETSLINDCGVR